MAGGHPTVSGRLRDDLPGQGRRGAIVANWGLARLQAFGLCAAAEFRLIGNSGKEQLAAVAAGVQRAGREQQAHPQRTVNARNLPGRAGARAELNHELLGVNGSVRGVELS